MTAVAADVAYSFVDSCNLASGRRRQLQQQQQQRDQWPCPTCKTRRVRRAKAIDELCVGRLCSSPGFSVHAQPPERNEATSRVLGVLAAQRFQVASLSDVTFIVLLLFVGMLVTSPGQPRYDLDHGALVTVVWGWDG